MALHFQVCASLKDSESSSHPLMAAAPQPNSSTGAFMSMSARRPLSSRRLIELKEAQKRTKDRSIHIGTIASVYAVVDQLCIYENPSYRKVSFDAVAKEFPDLIDDAKMKAIADSAMDRFFCDRVYGVLAYKLSQNEDFRHFVLDNKDYTVDGDNPVQADYNDQLYDLGKVRKITRSTIEAKLDSDIKEVQRRCLGAGMSSGTSNLGVVSVACCNFLMHKKCLQDCQANNVTRCLDSLCQSKVVWDKSFYDAHASKRCAVLTAADQAKTCSLCMEELQPQVSLKKKLENGSALVAGGINKKHRFL